MCSSANDREAGNDSPRENFRGVMSKFASRTQNLKRENVVKILMMQGNVMYKQLTNNLMCKQLRNMNKK